VANKMRDAVILSVNIDGVIRVARATFTRMTWHGPM